MKRKYRIILNNRFRYVSQVRYSYWPFWITIEVSDIYDNSLSYIADCERVICLHNKRYFVKYYNPEECEDA